MVAESRTVGLNFQSPRDANTTQTERSGGLAEAGWSFREPARPCSVSFIRGGITWALAAHFAMSVPPPCSAHPFKAIRTMARNAYQREVARSYVTVVPEGMRVLELGCASGDLLAALRPSQGVGIDKDPDAIAEARRKHGKRAGLSFVCADLASDSWETVGEFDYVILSDVVMYLADVQRVLESIRAVCGAHTRIILNYPSNVWRPVLTVASALGLRRVDPTFNWLSTSDLQNLLHLAGYEVIASKGRVLFPFPIPGVAALANRLLAKLPGARALCLTWFTVARPRPAWATGSVDGYSVSVLIPTRDERGNIEAAFRRTPRMGRWTELVFVDGASSDGTYEEILRCKEEYGDDWERIELLRQTGKGKGQAVRQGFAECRGDILMILDSDLTMPPEELPKFYRAIATGLGEFVNGCRLVYPMERRAMRFLNMVANYLFGRIFSYLLDQSVKDTLCGTKVLWRSDYEVIAANRDYFGDFDPFGDFDLLFGAARLNRRIVDMPIRYRERTYGDIKIHRWRHGVLLLRMSLVGFRQLKLRT